MPEELSWLMDYLTGDRAWDIVRAGLLVLAGLVLGKLVSGALWRGARRRLTVHGATLLRRASYYAVFVLFLVAALHQLGFNLGVLLGAAGVASLALGFAAQTSVSNLISGLFLIAERPFSVGDSIQVGGTAGEVLSIDLLSVKLRTFDNVFVRIPNEALIKTEVRTLSKFPIRRVDLKLGVGYGADISVVRSLLLELAAANPYGLENPPPRVLVRELGDSAVEFQYSVWAAREHYLELKSGLQEDVKCAFDAAGIEIPFPQVSLHAGSGSEPLAVWLTRGDDRA